MPYCDVIFDEVTKASHADFLISYLVYQIYHLKEHDKGTILPQIVPRIITDISQVEKCKEISVSSTEP